MALGRDVEMTYGGSSLDIAYLCDHKIAFGGWIEREGVPRVRVLGRRQRVSLKNLLLVEFSDRKQIRWERSQGYSFPPYAIPPY